MPLQLLACGSNPAGQLALGHLDDVDTFTPCSFIPTIHDLLNTATILDLVSSSTHSLLLLKTEAGNLLLGAGTNTLGQLGPRCALWEDMKAENSFKPFDLLGPAGYSSSEWTPVKIGCTWTTSFVVYEKDNGMAGRSGDVLEERGQQMVLACGSNDFGELGHEPVLEGHASDLPTTIDLGLVEDDTVELLKGGQRHFITIIAGPSGQRVVGWGSARKGELDPSHHSLSGNTAGSKRKGKAQAHPKTLPPTILRVDIPSGVTITDVALGASHSILLLSDGSLRFWGGNNHGQVTGLEDALNVKQIGATWNGSYLFTEDGLCSQGLNNHGQLLHSSDSTSISKSILVPSNARVIKLVCGSEHVLQLCEGERGSELWTGGWNEHGNLGLGDQIDRDKPEMVALDHGTVKGIWAGCAASWIWVDEGAKV